MKKLTQKWRYLNIIQKDQMGPALEFEVSYLKPEDSCIENEGILFNV